ncbi:MAG: 23S rRNA (uracil(1939)-C(5))-methyltransferase RlmD [Bacteroidia bacterium]|nr:23S rRNA (uracil(1939)-C(5))-methyltransferase RlmD [Bacteroidia bacterium]
MGRRKTKRLEPFLAEGLEIIDILKDGSGLARKDGKVIFVKDAVPGDVVDARVWRKHKGNFFADLKKLVKPSPDRVQAACAHFDHCGGCKYQNLSYPAQLRFKEKSIRDAFERIGKVEWENWRPIIGMNPPYHYRNKLEFTFGDQRWVTQEQLDAGTQFPYPEALGFNISGVYHKILDIDSCLLGNALIDEIRNDVREFAVKVGISFHNNKDHHGYLRNLVFRISEATGEVMIILVVWEDKPELLDKIFTHLQAKFPQITSFIWVINEKLNNSYYDQGWRLWGGKSTLVEQLGPWKFSISPTSFFQTNTSQAKVLYDVVREFVGEKVKTLYDLYCGAGSIGIYLSDLAEKVVGIEYVDDAVKDAKINLDLNGLSHLKFFSGDMRKMLTDEFTAKHGKPDVIVTDPPRNGMDKEVVLQLLKIRAPRIVYVSCGPSTQARDLELLKEAYRVVEVQPVDMFPHTAHVENVVLLELREG